MTAFVPAGAGAANEAMPFRSFRVRRNRTVFKRPLYIVHCTLYWECDSCDTIGPPNFPPGTISMHSSSSLQLPDTSPWCGRSLLVTEGYEVILLFL